jgi:hypothetical protein
MIQFINALGVTGKYKEAYLDDAVDAICIPVHRIVMIEGIYHTEVRDRFRYDKGADEDIINPHWTAIQWEGSSLTYTAYLRCRPQEVMMAISYLNQHPERTTCYVDDHSNKDMG